MKAGTGRVGLGWERRLPAETGRPVLVTGTPGAHGTVSERAMRLWTRARIGIGNLEDGGRKTCEFEVILGDTVSSRPACATK